MTALFSRFRRRSSSVVIVECRRCGTTLAEGEHACPNCEDEDLVRYEIGE